MAIFNNMYLTTKGQALYAKAQAGTQLKFTKLQIGSGNIGTTNPETLTALISPKYDVGIQSITPNTANKTATISGMISNSSVTTATYICEIGIFAQDPDDGEILYGYGSAGSYGDYMAPATQGAYSWNYQINAAIGNAANVTVTLSNLQYDYGVVVSSTFTYLSGGTQKEVNQSIDNMLKVYPATLTATAGVYSVTVSSFAFTDGYPLSIKFDKASSTAVKLIINSGSTNYAIVNRNNIAISSVVASSIMNLRYNATNSNFQSLGEGGGNETATADKVLAPYTVTINEVLTTGTMTNKSGVNFDSADSTTYTSYDSMITGTASNTDVGAFDIKVPKGFYDGNSVSRFHIPNLLIENIKAGVNVGFNGAHFTGTFTADGTATAAGILSGLIAYVNGNKITGTADINSIGGAYKASGSFYRSASSATVSLSFTPNVIITISADGGYVNIRQTAFSWFYTDVFFYNSTPSSMTGWNKATSSTQSGNSGNPCIVIGTNSFTWQAAGGSGDTIYYLALKV
jgi:hypothetical protein